MVSEWHRQIRSESLEASRRPRRQAPVKPNDYAEMVEAQRLEGWGKAIACKKAGFSLPIAQCWAKDDPHLAEVLSRFPNKRHSRFADLISIACSKQCSEAQ